MFWVTSKYTSFYKYNNSFGIIFSKKENIFGVHPLVISTFYIVLTLGVAAYLRRVVKSTTKDNIIRQMLLEFVATAELCATCFELIIGNNLVSNSN